CPARTSRRKAGVAAPTTARKGRIQDRPSFRDSRQTAHPPTPVATGIRPSAVTLAADANARAIPTTAAEPAVGRRTRRTVAQRATQLSAATHASSVASAPLARIVGEQHHRGEVTSEPPPPTG